MTIVHAIILLGTGTVVGFASGLLGIGGGFIMAPVQYIVFTGMGLSTDMAIRLAFGTNLLVILPTALSGTWRHNKQGDVQWKAAVIMGIGGTATAFGGATLATHLPGEALKIAFGSVALLGGIRMLISRPLRVEMEPRDNPWLFAAWSVPIGLLAGILGIGGGIMAVPVMVMALKFKMHTAIATSLAIMLFTSIGGIIGYIVNGIGVPDLPPYSIGYVNLPAWLLLAVSSIGMVQVGAITAHRLPAGKLRCIFVILMFYLGFRMLGVFDWLGWPL